jgi:hypothetical protein
MNHCIIGGVGDGDSGEDGGDEHRGAGAAAAPAGAGDSPTAGILGPPPPFPPPPPLPMEMGSMGEAKTWLWWLQIRGWRCPPRARVPPFCIVSRIPVSPSWAALDRT